MSFSLKRKLLRKRSYFKLIEQKLKVKRCTSQCFQVFEDVLTSFFEKKKCSSGTPHSVMSVDKLSQVSRCLFLTVSMYFNCFQIYIKTNTDIEIFA